MKNILIEKCLLIVAQWQCMIIWCIFFPRGEWSLACRHGNGVEAVARLRLSPSTRWVARHTHCSQRSSVTRSEMRLRGKRVRSWCQGSSHRSFMVDPLSYFSFQPVLHDWCNKGCGMCNPVCEIVHIKEPLLLIGKSSLCGGSGFPFSLSEWSLTICLMPYNRK